MKITSEQAAFDPKCFQSPAEFDKVYYRRVGEQERRKVDECPSRGPDKYHARTRSILSTIRRGRPKKTMQCDRRINSIRSILRVSKAAAHFAYLGDARRIVAAKVAGRDEDEALRWSEGRRRNWVYSLRRRLDVKVGAVARTGFQNYNEGPNVSRDVPLTPPPQNVAPPPTNEPIPSPSTRQCAIPKRSWIRGPGR